MAYTLINELPCKFFSDLQQYPLQISPTSYNGLQQKMVLDTQVIKATPGNLLSSKKTCFSDQEGQSGRNRKGSLKGKSRQLFM